MAGRPSTSELYNVPIRSIASRDRRNILAIVSETELIGVMTLSARIASKIDSQECVEKRTDKAKMALVHNHLPALQTGGFLTWDRDTDMVELTDHPALADPQFHRFIESESDRIDNALGALAHEFRRVTLTILWDEQDSIRREALAERLLEYLDEEGINGSLTHRQLAIDLHHRHLPELAAYEYIEYNVETGQISYTDDPLLDEIFRTVYQGDRQMTDRLSEFLRGLTQSYQETSRQSTALFDWPDSWRVPYDG